MEDVGDFVVSKQLVTCFTIIVFFFFYIFITATGKKRKKLCIAQFRLKEKTGLLQPAGHPVLVKWPDASHGQGRLSTQLQWDVRRHSRRKRLTQKVYLVHAINTPYIGYMG